MSKYNIGDKVYLEGKISEYDEKDNTYCVDYSDYHKFTHTSCWIKDDVLYPADEDYNKGLNDAWELAKKITLPIDNGGYSCDELKNIFGYRSPASIFKAFTPQEALAKVKAYEEEHIRIRVGDVVTGKGGTIEGIVTRVDSRIYRLFRDGSCNGPMGKEDLEKTGKHIERMAQKAFDKGIRHEQTKGNLNKWLTSKYFVNQQANNLRIYGDYLYVFDGNTLVTVFRVPNNLLKNMESMARK